MNLESKCFATLTADIRILFKKKKCFVLWFDRPFDVNETLKVWGEEKINANSIDGWNSYAVLDMNDNEQITGEARAGFIGDIWSSQNNRQLTSWI